MPKPIQVFKTGRHTDVSGKTIEFTEADLAACVAAYDPKLHEAPLVIGHPKLEAPAYGWVSSLAVRGGALEASPRDVDAAFAEAVETKRWFPKVSACFYVPDAPTNPTPGAYYLKHVGFLGAVPPAVKGLREVSFGEDDRCVTVEFSEYDVGTALRSLRDWLIGKFGQE